MNCNLILLYCFLSLSTMLLGQHKIVIKKAIEEKNCCDSLVLHSWQSHGTDTIDYDETIKSNGIAFGVSFINCDAKVSAVIHSFECSINQEKQRQVFIGNRLDFKNHIVLKNGGYILIHNVKVTCKNKLGEEKDIVLEPKKYLILPSKKTEE